MDAQKLLDAMVGARSAPPSSRETQPPPQSLQDMLGAFGSGKGDIGASLSRILQSAIGGLRDVGKNTNVLRQPPGDGNRPAGERGPDPMDELAQKVRDLVGGGGGLSRGALMGLAGLLLGTRSGRTLTAQLASFGGLALIGGLAYRAYKNARGDGPAGGINPAATTDAEALLFIRAMVSAMSADGHIDESERARIVNAIRAAGVGGEEASWLEREIAKPASIDELAAAATSPELAAQVYAAARLAIEPDTAQERNFLTQLANAMKLDAQIKREVDEGATGLKEDSAAA
jgi:uncharacterized membrane protein YebE (DUF533 family)